MQKIMQGIIEITAAGNEPQQKIKNSSLFGHFCVNPPLCCIKHEAVCDRAMKQHSKDNPQ